MTATLAPVATQEVPHVLVGDRFEDAQRNLERTPSNPILPPEPSRSFEVDESVKACETRLAS